MENEEEVWVVIRLASSRAVDVLMRSEGAYSTGYVLFLAILS